MLKLSDLPLSQTESPTPSQPLIRLACVELSRFRRLRAVRLDFADDTTVIVGPNDSGKSSLLAALQKFLAHATGRKDGVHFTAYDISADSWATLNQLGREWEEERDAESDRQEALASNRESRESQLAHLLAAMPVLDVWLDARDGAWHLVRDLIPTLEWAGGKVGVRLRLEPVSDLKELDRLIRGYLAVRQRVQVDGAEPNSQGHPPRAWPTDLLDYWKKNPSGLSRVRAYRLDPQQLRLPGPDGQTCPQSEPSLTRPLNEAPLRELVRVDLIPAQRGLGVEEAMAGEPGSSRTVSGLLSAQLVSYARGLLEFDKVSGENLENHRHSVVARALEQAHGVLDVAINAVLKERVDEVRELGYPALGDVQELRLRTEVDPAQALRHSAAVQYRSYATDGEAQHLPEHAIGLGYQNLLSLSFLLMRFRDDRLNSGAPKQDAGMTAPLTDSSTASPVPVHLVLLEEPEAHLHVQVQRSFVLRAYDRVAPKGRSDLSTSLLISTHSSHLAHAVDFSKLRYLRRLARDKDHPLPTSVIVSLAGLFRKGSNDEHDDTLRFVQRYLRVQHTDLLFADAVVLVEGTAERVLVPAFIERDHRPLRFRYLSLLDVGGSHAHRLRPLLETLAVPTLLLTDLDPAELEETTDKNGKQYTRAKKAPATGKDGLISTNPSIKAFLGGTDQTEALSVALLHKMTEEDKAIPLQEGETALARLRVAFQVAAQDGRPCGSSFEDALVLENVRWFRCLPEGVERSLELVRNKIESDDPSAGLAEELHELIGRRFDKGAFALDVFMRMNESHGDTQLVCPRYISESLTWLADELSGLDFCSARRQE